MRSAITTATYQATEANFDGVSRVVSVTESVIDEHGNVIENSMDAPMVSVMEKSEEEKQKEMFLARESARAQQEILAQLLSMRDEEREQRLGEARAARAEFETRLQETPPEQRVMLLQNLSVKIQRLLIMEKLWTSILRANGGKPPKMHNQSGNA
jgi:hypothetical protein